ncbi:hypothetical protein Cni_G06328 [Canna indica]|uniref:FLZ-type domain-containing protein n=1 Tax=Canna indica TaxID=4628 RepID=A0AAQ3Q3Y1_9LILI|nr:hypothetical protein Cni_G06328 [Canna indica]
MRERKNEEGVATWLLRKRVRPNIRRITSLRQFSAEDTAAAAAVGEEIQRQLHFRQREQRRAAAVEEFAKIAKNRSFNGSGATEMTAQFLMVCSFCNSHIGPGRDAFMYR